MELLVVSSFPLPLFPCLCNTFGVVFNFDLFSKRSFLISSFHVVSSICWIVCLFVCFNYGFCHFRWYYPIADVVLLCFRFRWLLWFPGYSATEETDGRTDVYRLHSNKERARAKGRDVNFHFRSVRITLVIVIGN